jgi:anti-sigma B factor antagonist
MGVKTAMHGEVAVITPEGTLWGGDETSKLKETIDDLVTKGNSRLVIDLGSVNHLNSTALGLLVSTHTNYAKRGGAVKLARVEKRISNILLITKLAMVFEAHSTVDEALKSFTPAQN